MSEMYEVRFQITVTGPPGRAEHFEKVADAFAMLEETHDAVLDSSFGFTDGDERSHMDVEVTVNAASEDEAHVLASSCLRSAIHEVGGFTPGWNERAKPSTAVYRLVDETVDRVALR